MTEKYLKKTGKVGEFPSPTLSLYSKPRCLDFLTGIAYHIRPVSLYIYIYQLKATSSLKYEGSKKYGSILIGHEVLREILGMLQIERMLIHTFLFWKRVHAVASAIERHAGDERTLSRPFAGNTRWTPKIKPLLANTITRYTFIKLNFPCFTVVKLRAVGGFLLFVLASSPHCYPHRKEIFVLDWTCCIYRSIRASERQSLIKRGLQVGTVQPTYPASPLAYINSPT